MPRRVSIPESVDARDPIDRTRRHVLHAMLAFPTAGLIGFTGTTSMRSVLAGETADLLALTPACDDSDDDPTPPQTEGPYFKPQSPERRTLLESGAAIGSAVPLTIEGRVMSSACAPI